MVLGVLARFVGLDFDPKSLKGNYSPRRVTPRNLPDDRTIALWRGKIVDPAWQWAYGILATYGLRPHEIFHVDFTDFPILGVLEGKTGQRRVWPIYPEWAELWDLNLVQCPNCTGKANADLGHRVSQTFRRLKIPFHAYDLRHCWAIRALEFGLDISLAAQQMGHSASVHTDLYHHWITDR